MFSSESLPASRLVLLLVLASGSSSTPQVKKDSNPVNCWTQTVGTHHSPSPPPIQARMGLLSHAHFRPRSDGGVGRRNLENCINKPWRRNSDNLKTSHLRHPSHDLVTVLRVPCPDFNLCVTRASERGDAPWQPKQCPSSVRQSVSLESRPALSEGPSLRRASA
eukprot:3117091-Rhodomonas_salina.1